MVKEKGNYQWHLHAGFLHKEGDERRCLAGLPNCPSQSVRLIFDSRSLLPVIEKHLYFVNSHSHPPPRPNQCWKRLCRRDTGKGGGVGRNMRNAVVQMKGEGLKGVCEYFPSPPKQNPHPTKMFPRESHGMVYAFRHIPRMPSFPPTTCFWKSYSNTPKSHSSLPGAIIPSRSISPLTGTLMSARNPNFTCVAVSFQSA